MFLSYPVLYGNTNPIFLYGNTNPIFLALMLTSVSIHGINSLLLPVLIVGDQDKTMLALVVRSLKETILSFEF